MTAEEATITAKTTVTPPSATTIQRSPLHSPVPYLFGGLAVMLGLIAFALLILACSYWKLSDQMNGAGEVEEATITGKTTVTPPSATTIQRSPWHSPVPYLFGGLAVMLGLIAFALLILACSYWKLSDQMNGAGEGERDTEAGDDDHKCENATTEMAALPFEEKIVTYQGLTGQCKPESSRCGGLDVDQAIEDTILVNRSMYTAILIFLKYRKPFMQTKQNFPTIGNFAGKNLDI
ncbi:unnamed protein product [Fraxinus pennsylvanica]|uniref:Uncharacterized protein n=1 Tax=Fraxinus pennsylvanica TaxID=56036 RepID=A0AAD1ZTP8_9LAMI|nr:unnamed protein product [Fraxinus pennsylvanica]